MNDRFEELRQGIEEFRRYRVRCIRRMRIFAFIALVAWIICMAVILT